MKTLPKIGKTGEPLRLLQVSLGKRMHIYTHMGDSQIQAALSSDRHEMGVTFPQEHVDAMLMFATEIAAYAVTVISWLVRDGEFEAEAQRQFERFYKRLTRFGQVLIPAPIDCR